MDLISFSASRAVVGAGTAYAMGINYKTGALIGVLSSLVDRIASYVVHNLLNKINPQTQKPTYLINFSIYNNLNRAISVAASFYIIPSKYFTPYIGPKLSIPHIFFVDYVCRFVTSQLSDVYNGKFYLYLSEKSANKSA
jgi:hypothetical protein